MEEEPAKVMDGETENQEPARVKDGASGGTENVDKEPAKVLDGACGGETDEQEKLVLDGASGDAKKGDKEPAKVTDGACGGETVEQEKLSDLTEWDIEVCRYLKDYHEIDPERERGFKVTYAQRVIQNIRLCTDEMRETFKPAEFVELLIECHTLLPKIRNLRKQAEMNKFNEIIDKPPRKVPDVNASKIYREPEDILAETENWRVKPVGTIEPGSLNTIDATFESFDYTTVSSALSYMTGLGEKASQLIGDDFWRWPIALFIGIFTALVALLIQCVIATITEYKYKMLSKRFQQGYDEIDMYPSYLFSLAFNIPFSLIAAFVCIWAPSAVGSGIPQIKSYLNGVNIPALMRFNTLVGKVVGVIFSVSAGLPVGKEGPMIHSGAVVAAGISQGKATSLPITTKYNKAYRSDEEKRDFVACGAAAGVAAAFGSPLGGLLFAIEEGASHINHGALWRIAMSSVVSYFVLNIVNSVLGGFAGQMSNGGLISFGEFDNASYNLYQMIVFFIMAILGGFSGALFNFLNEKLTQFRIRSMTKNYSKVMEVVSCGLTVSTLAFVSMIIVDDCREYDVDINNSPVRLWCQDGKASAAAGLWYKTPEETVRSLFHDDAGAHNFSTLAVFMVLYFCLACWTYGMTISSGLFVPSLLIGAAWGRLIGMSLYYVFPTGDWGDLGKYALIGASAQLAGTIRLTYSLTAIILEATGNLTYVFPVFVAVFASKLVGDCINEGLYDVHINILGIPLLPYQPPANLKTVTAKDMMNRNVKVVKLRSKVRDVWNLLEKSTHHAFPVVDTEDAASEHEIPSFGRLRGVMMRHDITTMLYLNIFVENGRFGTAESYSNLRERYPRFIQQAEFSIPRSAMNCHIDFSNAMNSAPYSAHLTMSMPALYSMFRGLGMRHMIVVNCNNEVVGMITRKEIAAMLPDMSPWPENKLKILKKTLVVNHETKGKKKRRRNVQLAAPANEGADSQVPYEQL